MIDSKMINEIRDKTDIVEIISEYLPLTARGKNYFGVCPFHEDHNPSMSVSKDKQIYKCFSCGASGNVYQFVMDYENMGFYETVVMLANRLGIILDQKIKTKKVNNEDEPLYNIYDLVNHLYVNNLSTKMGENARNYLHNRSLSEDTIKTFNIGLSLASNNLVTKFLTEKKINPELMTTSGLVINGHDAFVNRIMFPYHNLEGRVVGFSGRIYNTEDQSKYINTKETKIFKKGELLFNYHRAKDSIRLKRQVIVVEGVLDVLRLYEAGLKHVVAIMGSSITKEQMILLKRLAPNVYFCLDGDKAGENGMLLAIKEGLQQGINIKIIKLPKGDPDTYILERGIESFNLLLEESLSGLDYKIEVLSKKINPNDITTIKTYLESFREDLISIQDDVVLYNLVLNKLSIKAGLDVEELKIMLYQTAKLEKAKPVVNHPKLIINKVERAEQIILYYLLYSPNLIDYVLEYGVYFYNDNLRKLFNEIIYYADLNNEFNLADFITYIMDKPAIYRDLKLIMQLDYPDEFNNELIDDCMAVINNMNKTKIIEQYTRELENTNDIDEKLTLMQKIYDMKVGSEDGTTDKNV